MVRKKKAPTPEVISLTMADVEKAIQSLVEQMDGRGFETIIAVNRGGLVPARLLAAALGVTNLAVWDAKTDTVAGEVAYPALIVDDIMDSGATMARARAKFGCVGAVLVAKMAGADYVGIEFDMADHRWVVFFWEGSADKVGELQNGA